MNNNSKYIIPIINSNYNSLTKSEKKIADYVLKNAKEVIYLSVNELANKTHVGDSTIIRFCRSLDFDSYQSFKMMLAQEMVSPLEISNQNIKKNDTLQTIIDKITLSNKQIIEHNSKIINLETISNAIKILSDARKIIFYGVGASGITAADYKYKFMQIGFDCKHFTDPHMQAMSAVTLSSEDVVIGISHSGSTKDTVNSCSTAKEAGAQVICITAHNNSPITKIADIKILTASKDLPLSGGGLKSKMTQIYILDLLSTGLSIKNYEKTLKTSEKIAKSVLNKLY